MHRALIAASLSLLLAAPSARAGVLSESAECDGNGHVVVTWVFDDDPSNPYDDPAWIGYDVLRRELQPCGEFVLLNEEPIARQAGSHSRTFTDTPPAETVTYEYRVILVDANRQWLHPGSPECEPPCTGMAWASCPAWSSPTTVGTLQDLGWALLVIPCPESCWPSLYFTGPAADALRIWADGSHVYGLTGPVTCGSVEGCSIDVQHYEPYACGITPVAPTTWGRLKEIYR